MYGLYRKRDGRAAPYFETNFADYAPSEDDWRNERTTFEREFSEGGADVWTTIVVPLLERIREKPFDANMPEYADLGFAQYMGAKALFQYKLKLLGQFEEFVRIFDQVEVDAEKKALWDWVTAKLAPWKG